MIVNKEIIEEQLDALMLSYAYRQFTEEKAVEPPYIVWYFDNSNNFSADNIVYAKISELNIELYTAEKNVELEEKIENILLKIGIYWEKEEQWIESEALFEVLYYMEVQNA